MLESILDTVGRTPIVLLNRMTEGLQAKVAVKVECTNPGGSVKDRVAMAMVFNPATAFRSAIHRAKLAANTL